MGLDEELAAARRVGRWRNGTALVTNPTRSGDVTTALDDFNFDDDRDGSLCPFPAHIRRMNPRLVADDSPDAGPFLLRRGIPYGTEGSDGGSRHGLVFVAYQSSIGGQFEYLQRLRGVRTDLSGQSDGLLGVTAGPAAWPGKPARSRWVTPRGGEYFLVPSRSLLAKIAAGGDPRVMASG
jgi:deferrochelatase/peroxidase EfeB